MNFFVTATNTDVGKTFVTSSLLKAFLDENLSTIAIKPIQSGCTQDTLTDAMVYTKISSKNNFTPRYSLKFPSSPEYAAKKENIKIDFNEILKYCNDFLQNYENVIIEGAGGLFVPLNEKSYIIDLIQALNLPVVLVCKNELGVINQILLSIEALENRGLKLDLIVLNFSDLNDEISLSNLEYLKDKFNCDIINLEPNLNIQKASLKFRNFIKNYKKTDDFIDLEFDKNHLFHPYTSSIKPLKTYGVSNAKDSYIYIDDEKFKNKALIDGMSSWWCAYLGYKNTDFNKAIIKQINKFSHVMFGGLTHAPAINLGKKLLNLMPKNMNKIFYSDSGSVSVEVALKMALQFQQNKNPNKTKIATFKGGYHGDTFGAMSVCDPITGMHSLFKNTLAKQIFMPKPISKYGFDFDEKSLIEMKKIIYENKDYIAAIIVEPIVQGAGGMWFYHENYLKFLREICYEIDALLIFDEIATGFGRLGEMFAYKIANVNPDIICIGKALTGGVMSFAATICSKEVADGICENDRVFMHGPTFMANPLACSVAIKSLEILENSNFKEKVKHIEKLLKDELMKCYDFQSVKDVRVLGAIGVVEIDKEVNTENIQSFFVENGVWIRPFGKNIYIMPHFTQNDKELKTLCNAIYNAIKFKKYE